MEKDHEKTSEATKNPFKFHVQNNTGIKIGKRLNVHGNGRITRIIAYWQMISSCVALTVEVLFIMLAIYTSNTLYHDPKELRKMIKHKSQTTVQEFLSILWAAVFYLGLETWVQLWASVRLLRSTHHRGIDVADALEYVKFWRKTTLIFTIINAIIIGMILNLHCVAIAFVALRVIFMREVILFEKSLRRKAVVEAAFENGQGFFQIVIPKKSVC